MRSTGSPSDCRLPRLWPCWRTGEGVRSVRAVFGLAWPRPASSNSFGVKPRFASERDGVHPGQKGSFTSTKTRRCRITKSPALQTLCDQHDMPVFYPLMLTTCHVRYHIALWDNRSIGQL